LAHFNSDISTAEEETVDGVGGGFVGGGVVEFEFSVGVGGQGREDGVDIGTVVHAYILGQASVFTDVVDVKLGRYVSCQVEEGKHGKEHDGKREEGIKGRHFDEQICKAIFSIVLVQVSMAV
jgi:hypothetical protein